MANSTVRFVPAYNNADFVKATLKSINLDKNDKNEEFIDFVFDVKGLVRGSSKEFKHRMFGSGENKTDFVIDADSTKHLFTVLGYEYPVMEITTDADGFNVQALGEVDEDGFSDIEAPELDDLESILEILRDSIGKHFKCKTKSNKGYVNLDVSTLESL